ncbi:MAG: hypothetical protein IH878_04995 [Gemmatimonadetes bacterium]|nr:hypothetical protein [Gemmatimonadota bacterium]
MTRKPSAHSATKPLAWLLLFLAGVTPVGKLAAQDFTPPEVGGQESDQGSKIKIGFYGFGTRLGWDLEDGDAIISITFDLGNLGSDQVRLRPSAEIGFGEDVDTYVVSAELLYRFTPDTEKAIPYVGLGLAVAGRDNCSTGPSCPEAWLQFVLGFEVEFRSSMNWLLEYHAEDALNRHRLFFGLTTRRGG